jgi:rod shape determining protein RodA
MNHRKGILQGVDWIGVILYLMFVIVGIMSIYATEYRDNTAFHISTATNYGKQIIFLGISLMVGFIILIIDSKFYSNFAWGFYGFIILMLVAVLFLGKTVNGANAWFEFGAIRLQPAEFGKFAACIALAKYLGSIDVKFEKMRTRLISGLIMLVPMVLIFAQHDVGSMLVFTAFIFVFYREGMPSWVLFGGIALILICVLSLVINKWYLIGAMALVACGFIFLVRKQLLEVLLVCGVLVALSGIVFGVDFFVNKVLEEHQRNRINVILGKVSERDEKTIAYNLYQSKIAIGSGGLTGRGYLQGLQTKGNFVPEMSTDFIFCSFAEEHGFLGCTLLIIFYLFFFLRIMLRAEEQRSTFGRVYAYGVASIFFFHFMVNMGMTIGLFPVIGIPLPFISYGGSSLLAFTILYFIYLKIDTDRTSILR